MTQRSLFPSGAEAIAEPVITLNRSVPAEAAPRLKRQCRELIERLRRGPISNLDLVRELGILNGTGLISDCRAAGYRIDITERDYKSGRVVYALTAEPASRGQEPR